MISERISEDRGSDLLGCGRFLAAFMESIPPIVESIPFRATILSMNAHVKHELIKLVCWLNIGRRSARQPAT